MTRILIFSKHALGSMPSIVTVYKVTETIELRGVFDDGIDRCVKGFVCGVIQWPKLGKDVFLIKSDDVSRVRCRGIG